MRALLFLINLGILISIMKNDIAVNSLNKWKYIFEKGKFTATYGILEA